MTADTRRQIRFRHLMMRILPYMPWKNLVAKKIAEEVQRGANAITLKDHPAPAAVTGHAPAAGSPTYAA
ncbi:hypothetical protein NCG97_21615 [Streptomyces lydicamycinicus]|uniref:hypothetical protein n=1 Tax=Streptomyces lydicamycinicus TaxID=1546107 RepID=UPI00203584CF|nr:hypothetical protein [Streptomyces lydicamycinicus]USA02673.1 hypothetical protein NCG97_21615 [Streptomyces lydicamycinicus]